MSAGEVRENHQMGLSDLAKYTFKVPIKSDQMNLSGISLSR